MKERYILIMNYEMQYYKGIPLQLVKRKYDNKNAKRFTINKTNQNVWIPNKHLEKDGSIRTGENIDYIFRKAQNQLRYAGITQAIPGIKRKTKNNYEMVNVLPEELKHQTVTFAVVTDDNGVVQQIGKSYILLPFANK